MKERKILLFSLAFVCLLLLPIKSSMAQYQLSQNQLDQLKLNLDLASIEVQGLKEQLVKAKTDVNQLKIDLDNAEKSYKKLSETLATREASLAQANKRRRNATIAGVLLGIGTGTGATLSVTGACTQKPILTYTGLGIAATSLITWITGVVLEVW